MQYQLFDLQFSGGKPERIPTATVTLAGGDGQTLRDAAPGHTAIHAVYNAIERILGVKPTVSEWNTTSRDVVKLVLHENGIYARGVGNNEDIVVASALAFLDAINQLFEQKTRPQEVPASA